MRFCFENPKIQLIQFSDNKSSKLYLWCKKKSSRALKKSVNKKTFFKYPSGKKLSIRCETLFIYNTPMRARQRLTGCKFRKGNWDPTAVWGMKYSTLNTTIRVEVGEWLM